MKKIFFTIFITTLFLSGCNVFVAPTNNKNTTSDQNNNTNQAQQKNNQNNVKIDIDKVLNFSNQKLTKIPDFIFAKTNLEELDVSNNQLTGAVQAEIRHLQNLKVLNLSNNQMTGVPAEIGQLSNLEVLNLSNNQLTGLPYELGNLKNLQTLNLSGNNYSEQDLEVIKKGLPADVNIIK